MEAGARLILKLTWDEFKRIERRDFINIFSPLPGFTIFITF